MYDRAALIDDLANPITGAGEEGYRQFAYQDSRGILTVGIGRNLQSRGVTWTEAVYLVNNDIDSIERDLNIHIPWWIALPDNAQHVLVDMAFNLGINGLLSFQHMLDALKDRRYEAASLEMIHSKWASQVGDRATTLSNMMKNCAVTVNS